MTPIENHRKQPLDYPNLTPRQHAVKLHDAGVEWDTACHMAGFDEREDLRRSMRIWVGLCLLALAAISLGVFLPSSMAAEPERDAAKTSEFVLVECLNGKPIRVGDQYFYCTSLGVLK